MICINEQASCQRLHILLAEDDKDYYEIFDEYLKREGYDVSVAKNVKEASKIINNSKMRIDLICLDILLDGMFASSGELKEIWMLRWTYLLDCLS